MSLLLKTQDDFLFFGIFYYDVTNSKNFEEDMFLPGFVCPSVLFVCEQDNSKT